MKTLPQSFIVCVCLALAGCCGPANRSSCVPPPAGLVGWWRGEGNAADALGRNPGVLRNGVTFAAGKVGKAFDLDGETEYVEVPDSESLNPSEAITVEAWIYPRLPLDPVAAPIIKKACGGGTWKQDYGYSLELLGPKRVRFAVFLDGNQGWSFSDSTRVPTNTWSHVAGVYDGKTIRFYFNGEPVGPPIERSGRIVPSASPLLIGHDNANPTRYFNGLIDEASVYDTALSAEQIKAIYNAGSAGKCPPAGSTAPKP